MKRLTTLIHYGDASFDNNDGNAWTPNTWFNEEMATNCLFHWNKALVQNESYGYTLPEYCDTKKYHRWFNLNRKDTFTYDETFNLSSKGPLCLDEFLEEKLGFEAIENNLNVDCYYRNKNNKVVVVLAYDKKTPTIKKLEESIFISNIDKIKKEHLEAYLKKLEQDPKLELMDLFDEVGWCGPYCEYEKGCYEGIGKKYIFEFYDDDTYIPLEIWYEKHKII